MPRKLLVATLSLGISASLVIPAAWGRGFGGGPNPNSPNPSSSSPSAPSSPSLGFGGSAKNWSSFQLTPAAPRSFNSPGSGASQGTGASPANPLQPASPSSAAAPASASPGQVNQFLGLPSDEGMHGVSGSYGKSLASDTPLSPAQLDPVGYSRLLASKRYAAAMAIRSNFFGWRMFGMRWFLINPSAWMAQSWAAEVAWESATWNSAMSHCNYQGNQPLYYDYGSNVVSQANIVYINGEAVATVPDYYAQAVALAESGAKAEVSDAKEEWLPLGVFAIAQPPINKPDGVLHLAINRQGVLRGNYVDSVTEQAHLVRGSVDLQSQRAAFMIGDNTVNIVETGLYNLTKDEAPALLHLSKTRNELRLLVRMQNPEGKND